MKKTLLALTVMAVSVVMPSMAKTHTKSSNKTTNSVMMSNPKDSYAEIKFDTLRHDFGKFSKNDPVRKCTFTFTNTGTAPLVIHQAFASCGCTVPSYPKSPIKPGEKGQIDVTYNGTGKFPGHFQKTITVRTNCKTEITRLTIAGEMLDK